jgi:general nucleoside transport system permease protein
MDALFQIPVIGVLLQLVAYLVTVIPQVAPIILFSATPIALGAMCGVMCERSGIVNIGIEGMMLTAAFVGFMVAITVNAAIPSQPGAVFGATPALLLGLLAAVLAGVAVSALHAWMSITARADQIISGTAINILALGLTGYLNRLIGSTASAGTFQPYKAPAALVDIPVVGWIFNMFLSQGPITMSVIVIVVVLQVLLFRSRWGLRTRAVGEHPKAADTVGINVIALRYRNVLLAGIFAGLAGGWLTLEATGSFQNGMTTGRGFIALAAVIVGRWNPVGAFAAALLFGASDALGVAFRSNPPSDTLGDIMLNFQTVAPSIYNNFFSALPYVVTIVVLAGVVGRSTPPAADGQPYIKEGAT